MTATEPQSILERYRPRRLAEVVGQSHAVEQLRNYAAEPYPAAFLLLGETGVGKSCSAIALAHELGVAVADGTLGGFFSIASGEQDSAAVRKAVAALRFRPLTGSGWKVLLINEADCMTDGAAQTWLDALEDLPPRSTVAFTSNRLGKFPDRFLDRCQIVEFESAYDAIAPGLRRLVERVWRSEGCRGKPPALEDLPVTDGRGHVSIRRVLQTLAVLVRQELQVRRGRTVCPA